MGLRAIYFSPGVVVSLAGKVGNNTSWRADENRLVKPEVRPNGDIWFHRPDGMVSKVGRHSIAWTLEDEEPAMPTATLKEQKK